jgi:predicted GNAT superfamily acetyltransferase
MRQTFSRIPDSTHRFRLSPPEEVGLRQTDRVSSHDTTSLRIRELTTVEQVVEASAVFDEVWPGERSTMPANILRALEHSGNYVVGLYDGDRMIGASAAFFGPPSSRSMHSHITGVLPGHQGRGVGRMLKNHQRDWAIARDVGHITWTFDPLIARNAHFNLRVLGARTAEYLVNQYGDMADDVNRGDASDRLLVSWALAAPPVPTPGASEVRASVSIPADIERLRQEAPAEAASWRLTVREQLLGHLASGLVIGGFDDSLGYVLVAP